MQESKLVDKENRQFKFSKVYIEITNECNLNCEFCPKTTREMKKMSISEFEKAIEKVKKYTDLVCFHVKGEPLMHPDLGTFLEICEKNNLMVNITTNGLLLEKWIDVFKKSKSLRQLNISLHSVEQNDNLDEDKYLKYVFSTVKEITKDSDVIISYRLWNINDLKNNKINQKILNGIEEFYNVKKIVKRSKKEKFIEITSKIFLNQDYKFTWPDMNLKVINENGKCYGLRNQIGILADGTIVPCCLDGDGNINLGNIFEINSIDDVLKSERGKNLVEGFRNKELREELCKRCGFVKKFDDNINPIKIKRKSNSKH